MKFKASCGRGLTDENLKFLAGKAFRWGECVYLLTVLTILFAVSETWATMLTALT